MHYGTLMYGGTYILLASALATEAWLILFLVALGEALFRVRTHVFAQPARDAGTMHLLGITLFGIGMAAEIFLLTRVASFGLWLVVLGGLGNALAIACNGGKMPVDRDSSAHPMYAPIGPSTRLLWLCDIFPSGHWVFSIGDAALVVGTWVFAAELWLARV